MRLKEIENGTIVHCETNEEAKKLIELTGSDNVFEEYRENNCEKTAYRIEDGKIGGYSDLEWYENNGYKIVKFSDLIEDELTAEEALKIYAEVCVQGCANCPLFEDDDNWDCNHYMKNNTEKVIEILAEWKAQQEKKEPEVEWVYRVFDTEDYEEKFFQTEDEAIARCEELAKTQKTHSYAGYIRACRVKGE